MALVIPDDELPFLAQALEAALEVLNVHRRSEQIFCLDGFNEYGGGDVEGRLHELRIRVREAIDRG